MESHALPPRYHDDVEFVSNVIALERIGLRHHGASHMGVAAAVAALCARADWYGFNAEWCARLTQPERETIGVLRALRHLRELRGEMAVACRRDGQPQRYTLFLTVDTLLSVHAALMEHIDTARPGVLRGALENVVPLGDDGAIDNEHAYVRGEDVDVRLAACIDAYNERVYAASDADAFDAAVVAQWAARLLSQFLIVHPFHDGNGRMGHLLVVHAFTLVQRRQHHDALGRSYNLNLNHTLYRTAALNRTVHIPHRLRRAYIAALVACQTHLTAAAAAVANTDMAAAADTAENKDEEDALAQLAALFTLH